MNSKIKLIIIASTIGLSLGTIGVVMLMKTPSPKIETVQTINIQSGIGISRGDIESFFQTQFNATFVRNQTDDKYGKITTASIQQTSTDGMSKKVIIQNIGPDSDLYSSSITLSLDDDTKSMYYFRLILLEPSFKNQDFDFDDPSSNLMNLEKMNVFNEAIDCAFNGGTYCSTIINNKKFILTVNNTIVTLTVIPYSEQ